MGNQYSEASSMKEICRGIRECKRGVSYKDGPMEWYIHSYTKGKKLKDDITTGRYKLRPGTKVQIYRPKRREAVAPWFRDRVWQRCMCNNGVYDDLTRGLTYDNTACQKGKGTDQAIRRTIKMLQQIYRETGSNQGWGIHRDVRKYFPSTPHSSIHELDRQRITDPMFLPFLDEIVDSLHDERPPEIIAADPYGERGTGLGSQINQLHQVALLSPIDHELLTISKHSQRYMDDFLVLDAEKDTCIRAGETIDRMLAERGFQSVDKSGLFRLSDGFYFLRHFFKLTETGKVIVRLHPDTLKLERDALRGQKRLLDRGETTMEKIRVHYQCFIAQAEYSTGDGAIRAMDKFYTELFREKPTYKRKRRYFYGNQNHQRAAPRGAPEERSADGPARPGECGPAVPGDDDRHRP